MPYDLQQRFAQRITHACRVVEDSDGNTYSRGGLPVPSDARLAPTA